MKSFAYILIAVAGSAIAQDDAADLPSPSPSGLLPSPSGYPTGDGSSSSPSGLLPSPSGYPTGSQTGGGPDPPQQTGCPTVTVTGILCSTCVIPACLVLATATQRCDCPDPIPTVTVDFPCDGYGGCGGAGCATSWEVADEPCKPTGTEEPTGTDEPTGEPTDKPTDDPDDECPEEPTDGPTDGPTGTGGEDPKPTGGDDGGDGGEEPEPTSSIVTGAGAGRLLPFWAYWL